MIALHGRGHRTSTQRALSVIAVTAARVCAPAADVAREEAMRRAAALALLLLAVGCARPAAAPRPRVVTIVAVSEVRGTPEPCGCQSDPLGDVARVASLARGGLLVDAGGLRYGEDPIAEAAEAQGELKGRFLEQAWP